MLQIPGSPGAGEPTWRSEDGKGDGRETGLSSRGRGRVHVRGTDSDSVAGKHTGERAVAFLHVAQGGCWEGKRDVTVSPSDEHSFISRDSC